MGAFEFIQKFFLILLPGIIGVYVYSAINIRKEQHYYFEFLKMIVLSFAAYLLADMFFGTIKYFFPCFIYGPIDIIDHIGSNIVEIPSENVFLATLFSIALACFLTKANSENWAFKVANKLKLTRRANNQCVWDHIFDENSVIIIRDYVTNNTYFGHVQMVSDIGEYREISLDDVDVYDQTSEFLYHADKLYISRIHNEFTVEVQNESIEEKE